MKGEASNAADFPLRGKVRDPFCCIGNEVFDVFLPIMGADCFAVYACFARMVFSNPKLKHTVRGMASATGLGVTTVFRSLEILERLGLMQVIRFGGGKRSECQLFDERELVNRLGAVYNRSSVSFSLPPEVAERLNAEVTSIRTKQQGKPPLTTMDRARSGRMSPSARVSQRNTSVSLRARPHSTGETQMGTHLIREERRNEDGLSPTPFHAPAELDPQEPSTKGEAENLLQSARDLFTGVMKDMGNHMLDTSKPQSSHYANGFADWDEFTFDSLAVAGATKDGNGVVLTLTASDPAAARRGLEKYKKKWEAILRYSFGDAVTVHVERTEGKL